MDAPGFLIDKIGVTAGNFKSKDLCDFDDKLHWHEPYHQYFIIDIINEFIVNLAKEAADEDIIIANIPNF